MSKVNKFITKNKIEDSFYESEGSELLINCNDFFCWASADCEEVTEENMVEVQKSIDDAIEVAGEKEGRSWGPLLFAARLRGLRPQGGFYPDMPDPIKKLFNDAGSDRDVDFCNPKNQDGVMYPPEYKSD